MTIRAGTAADLADIERIQSESPEASHWEPRDYLDYVLHVACIESRTIGFIVTRSLAMGEFEILNLAVARNARRQGIASELVKAALAAEPGVHYLEVRESNEAARAFYSAKGFEQVGIRSAYYRDPEEAAIVMRICS